MSGNTNKIVNNTIIIYVNMILKILLTFFTTKLLLSFLGVEDFGLLTLVTSVVTMLSFMSTTMSNTTQRFLSFSIGTKELNRSRETFVNCFFIHVVIACLALVLFETIGIYFLNQNLKIPGGKIYTANILFQFVVIISILNVLISPFIGLSNSYERMFFVTFIETSVSIFKLLSLLFIIYIYQIQGDKLLYYGFVLLLITFLSSLIIIVYCVYNFKETKNIISFEEINKKYIYQILNYSIWNLFGVFVYIARNQGVAIVLNLFYGLLVNTAYGVANQVSMQLFGLTNGVSKSIRPQLVQKEGAGDRAKMMELSYATNKYSFYIFVAFSFPIFLEMPLIFRIWLGDIPQYSIAFCRLLIVILFIKLLTTGLICALEAIGDIKKFQITTGVIKLLGIPLSFVLYKLNYSIYIIFYIEIISEIILFVYRIKYIHKLARFTEKIYFKMLLNKMLIPFLVSVIITMLISNYLYIECFYRIIFVFILFNTLFFIQIFSYCLSIDEKRYIISKLNNVLKRSSD